MVEWNFEEKIYRRWLCLMIGPFEELKAELKEIELEDWEELPCAAGYNIRLTPENNKNNSSYTIIWLPKFDAGILVHELAHYVMHTFDKVGVPISLENEEAFAFYIGYWWKEIDRVRRKYPNGRTGSQVRSGK